MFYFFIKFGMRFAFRVYFKKIYLSNTHNIPRKAPIVMPVNHPTAFTEPVIIGTFLRRAVHFILKGNVFSTPITRWILNDIKTIPIFRLRDGGGFASLRQNTETMELVNQKLNNGEIILILAEGLRKNEKRLRPIQKGAARMVFKYYDTYKKDDLAILNVGVNYTNATAFRSEIMVDFGPPLWLKDYLELYQEHDRKALNKLTKDIKNGLLERVIHIENAADDELVNRLLDLNRSNRDAPIFPLRLNNDQPLREALEISRKINQMEAGPKGVLRQKVHAYDQDLKQLNLDDFAIANPGYGKLLNLLWLILGALPAWMGYLTNCLPVLISENLAFKKADGPESLASLRPALGMVIYFVYFVLLLIPCAILGNPWLWLALFLMPLAGYFFIIWKEFGDKWKEARKFRSLKDPQQTELKHKRKEILSFL